MRATEDIRYPAYVHPSAQIDRIATMLYLTGMPIPDIDNARILEIGCAYATNLAVMAELHPNSSFLGIDIDPTAIKEGKELAKTAGLKNIELIETKNMLSTLTGREFDYIIAHGFLSWVSDDTKDELFKICTNCLSPKGAAYISYNCNPGWLQASSLRDLFYNETNQLSGTQRIKYLRTKLRALKKALNSAAQNSTSQTHFISEITTIESMQDGHMAAELFSEHNDPLYFSEFCQLAEEHGLQYVADANPNIHFAEGLAIQTHDFLSDYSSNAVLQLQMVDFLVSRRFRSSIIRKPSINSPAPPLKIELRPSTLNYRIVKTITSINQESGSLHITLSDDNSFIIPEIYSDFAEALQNKHFASALEQSASLGNSQKYAFSEILRKLMSCGVLLPTSATNNSKLLDTSRPHVSLLNRTMIQSHGIIANINCESGDAPFPEVIKFMDGRHTVEEISIKSKLPVTKLQRIIDELRFNQIVQFEI